MEKVESKLDDPDDVESFGFLNNKHSIIKEAVLDSSHLLHNSPVLFIQDPILLTEKAAEPNIHSSGVRCCGYGQWRTDG